ncbi:hypothetical protein [Prauserella flavalba]|uniref:hypothetical protein n=1 Tax=Prauserella flavalba TaxID=1477506 RepID=UPI0011B4595C|nr:hypothetical protein [Prauserella flavalba]
MNPERHNITSLVGHGGCRLVAHRALRGSGAVRSAGGADLVLAAILSKHEDQPVSQPRKQGDDANPDRILTSHRQKPKA